MRTEKVFPHISPWPNGDPGYLRISKVGETVVKCPSSFGFQALAHLACSASPSLLPLRLCLPYWEPAVAPLPGGLALRGSRLTAGFFLRMTTAWAPYHSKAEAIIMALLREKGVPEAEVAARTSQAGALLSKAELLALEKSLHPWQDLKKAVGNRMILVRQGGSKPKESAQGSEPLWDNDPSQKTSAELLAPQMSFLKMARNRSSLSKWSMVPLDLPSSALTWLNRSWTLVRGALP